jgi:hypothetical protein
MMQPVERPRTDAGEVFQTCISHIRDRGLRRRLSSIRPHIEAAGSVYEQKAETGDLHLIRTATTVAGCVTKDEMIRVYDQRMASKTGPGRAIYDQIKLLPPGDRCPFCDQRYVSTLDHFLPKALYPALAVMPVNLVGACFECNRAKPTVVPTSRETVVLHPYFDDITREHWLTAQVLQQTPCAVLFRVVPPRTWDAVTTARVNYQFNLLGLPALYSNEAAREITNIRHNLQLHFDAGGADTVRDELLRQWRSRRANRLNSWQTATYEALSHDAWFYGGGFAPG